MGLSSHVVVSVDIPSICHTTLYYLQCLYSYPPHTLTPSLKIWSFQCPYVCCAMATAFVSTVEKVLLFFCLSWQCINHWWLASNWPLVCHAMFNFIFMCGQPCTMYDFSFKSSASSWVAACRSFIDVHTGIFTVVLTAYGFMFIPVIT